MKKTLRVVDRVLTYIEENIIFIFMSLLLLTVFWGLLNRYVFQSPLSWSEELSRYLSIWATFIAASYGVKKGIHISIDTLTLYLPEKANRLMRAFSYIVSIAFCITILIIGIPFIIDIMNLNQVSPSLRLPMYSIYLAVVTGFFFMMIRFIILFISDIVYKEKPIPNELINID